MAPKAVIRASYAANSELVSAAFKDLQANCGTITALGEKLADLLHDIVSDKDTRAAILPPTVGWFALTFDSSNVDSARLQVLGSNTDGYLIFSFLTEGSSEQLCALSRGETAALPSIGDKAIVTLKYIEDRVQLVTQAPNGQYLAKNIIIFSGRVPKSKIGRGDSVARPLDDRGVNREYLDHSLVNLKGEGAPVRFARTHHKVAAIYSKHSHMDDNVRVICSGRYKFTIFDPDTDVEILECEVSSGDTIQIPAGYPYIEEVVEPGTVINSRFALFLHYLGDSPAALKSTGKVTISLGINEKG